MAERCILIFRPGYLRHTEQLLPLLPSGPDGVHNIHVAQGLVVGILYKTSGYKAKQLHT